jgi:hypothetical protein
MIRAVNSYIHDVDANSYMFSREALSREGIEIAFGKNEGGNEKNMHKLRLIADEDIMFIAKNCCTGTHIDEYFDRSFRKKPLWKSEAEYISMLKQRHLSYDLQNPDNPESVISEAISLNEFLINNFSFPNINDDVLSKLKDFGEDVLQASAERNIDILIKWTTALYSAAKKCSVEKDFAIITTEKKKSRFNDKNFDKLQIWFPQSKERRKKKDVHTSYKGNDETDTFFYIYLRKNKAFDTNEFIKHFIKELNELLGYTREKTMSIQDALQSLIDTPATTA